MASHGSREFSEVSRAGAHSKPAALWKKIRHPRCVVLGVSSAERHVERCHRGARRVVGRVPIDIAGETDRAVPEQIRDGLYVGAVFEPRHRGAVPQGVHADVVEAGALRR